MIKEKYAIKQVKKNRLRKMIRKNVNGTHERPRMIIVKTNKYLYTQVYDDENGKVIAYASTLEKDVKTQLKGTKNRDAAKVMGKVIADRLKQANVAKVVFDRNFYPFTGKIKVFADSARENGIQF